MSPHPHRSPRNDDDEPEVRIRLLGFRAPHFVIMVMLAVLGYGEYRPKPEAAEQTAKLAPIYEALNEVKTTLAVVDATMRQQGIELADHETRLRSAEQWSQIRPLTAPEKP